MKRLEEIRARLASIQDELTELRALEAAADEEAPVDDDHYTRTDELVAEWDVLTAEAAPLEERAQKLARIRAATDVRPAVDGDPLPNRDAVPVPGVRTSGDPFDPSVLLRSGASELRARAHSAIEATDFLEDDKRQALVKKMETMDDVRGAVPQLVIATGHRDYQSAFHKGLAGRQDLWTNAEREAVNRVEQVRAAMSLTDANGGYAVPFTLDPTLIMTDAGSNNAFRQVCRIETIVTDTWNGLTTAGVTASYDSENAEVSDDSPTFAQPTITPKMGRAFVQGSIQISQDYQNLASDLGMLFQDARDDLEATDFTTGATGIITALDGGASELAPATAEVFAYADIFTPQNGLPAKHRGPSARKGWMAELSTINKMRQLASAAGDRSMFNVLTDGPIANLLGWPLYENSSMKAYSAFDAGATADNFLLLVGNWLNYIIVDRVGLTVEFIPHLFATNANLPSGTRGWFAYWRTGSDSVNDDAFRVLSIPTAA